MKSLKVVDKLKEGDRVLFNERKIPLTVETVDDNRIHLKGPKQGEYILFKSDSNGKVLVKNKGSSRKYAQYVEDLRNVGKWEKQDEKLWKHSKTGETIEIIKKDTGFWGVSTDLDFDLPKYGFSDIEYAYEKVEQIMEKNPEGEKSQKIREKSV